MGQKQMTEKKKKREERKRPKVVDNNGQATHGACKTPGPTICQMFDTFTLIKFNFVKKLNTEAALV